MKINGPFIEQKHTTWKVEGEEYKFDNALMNSTYKKAQEKF
jgi:hypothetical protein